MQKQMEKQKEREGYNNFSNKEKPLIDLQIYEPSKPKTSRPNINTNQYLPNLINPLAMNNTLPCFNQPMIQPIVQNISLNTTGPTADHSKISIIYEDELPGKNINFSSFTIGDRLNMYYFIRSVFIRQNDGEDINLDGSGNSLLSYLKFLELNPYSINLFSNNPYKSLPQDMLIYKSCYPIRYDAKTGLTQCANNSVGINIRIYKMTFDEYNIKKSITSASSFDLWREIAYYEFIRENILKKKISPNFIIMFGYYICENCNIDFEKLKIVRGANNNCTNSILNNVIQSNNTIPQKIIITPNNIKLNLNSYSGKCLVALTEAPLYNLYSWASRTYLADGNINKMINPGFHKSEIWLSILFQLISALYLLQKNNIAFKNFSLQDNVYIKDINIHQNINNYWKYIIDGIEYYIPNYGYLLLIDSNYKDKNERNHSKIYAEFLCPDHGVATHSKDSCKNNIYNMNYENFLNSFNTNVFSSDFTNNGGTKPPEDILALINNIHKEASLNKNKNIEYYISKYFTNLMNNRIGTLLNEIEVKNIRKEDKTPFIRGQLIVQEFRHDTYRFCLFLKKENNMNYLLTRNDPKDKDYIEIMVTDDMIYNYSKYENIQQTFKPNESNLNEEDLLETYVM